jgi:hypothetical protein
MTELVISFEKATDEISERNGQEKVKYISLIRFFRENRE